MLSDKRIIDLYKLVLKASDDMNKFTSFISGIGSVIEEVTELDINLLLNLVYIDEFGRTIIFFNVTNEVYLQDENGDLYSLSPETITTYKLDLGVVIETYVNYFKRDTKEDNRAIINFFNTMIDISNLDNTFNGRLSTLIEIEVSKAKPRMSVMSCRNNYIEIVDNIGKLRYRICYIFGVSYLIACNTESGVQFIVDSKDIKKEIDIDMVRVLKINGTIFEVKPRNIDKPAPTRKLDDNSSSTSYYSLSGIIKGDNIL